MRSVVCPFTGHRARPTRSARRRSRGWAWCRGGAAALAIHSLIHAHTPTTDERRATPDPTGRRLECCMLSHHRDTSNFPVKGLRGSECVCDVSVCEMCLWECACALVAPPHHLPLLLLLRWCCLRRRRCFCCCCPQLLQAELGPFGSHSFAACSLVQLRVHAVCSESWIFSLSCLKVTTKNKKKSKWII